MQKVPLKFLCQDGFKTKGKSGRNQSNKFITKKEDSKYVCYINCKHSWSKNCYCKASGLNLYGALLHNWCPKKIFYRLNVRWCINSSRLNWQKKKIKPLKKMLEIRLKTLVMLSSLLWSTLLFEIVYTLKR